MTDAANDILVEGDLLTELCLYARQLIREDVERARRRLGLDPNHQQENK